MKPSIPWRLSGATLADPPPRKINARCLDVVQTRNPEKASVTIKSNRRRAARLICRRVEERLERDFRTIYQASGIKNNRTSAIGVTKSILIGTGSQSSRGRNIQGL